MLPQPAERGTGFHALGDELQAKVVGEVDRRPDDGGIGAIVRQLGDEGLVDLEFVHGQVADLRERGIAGAEVVDGNLDAEVAQPLEDDGRVGEVADKPFLGNLRDEVARREIMVAQQFQHEPRQVLVEEIVRGEVHRHWHVEALLEPEAALAYGGRQRPSGQDGNVPRLLGNRYELGGREPAQPRVIPAHQRLGSADLPIG